MVLVAEHAPSAVRVDIGIRIGMPCFILLLTALRMYLRGPRRWQWDDGLICMGCGWLLANTPLGVVVILRFGHMDPKQLALNVAFYLTFLCALWSCRLSILMSIARITPGDKERKRRELLSIGFVLLGFLELGQVGVSCGTNTSWNLSLFTPKCLTSKRVPLTHLITSVLSDFMLVALPLYTLSGLRHNFPRTRVRLSLAFAASVCTTALSISAAMATLLKKAFNPHYLGSFEGYTAFIVCHLPVLMVALLRVFKLSEGRSEDYNKAVPPIKFAPKPKTEDDSMEIAGISTDDICRSTPSWHSFANGVRSFPPPGSGMRSPTITQDDHMQSFLGRLKTVLAGFHADEDKCIEEARTAYDEGKDRFDADVELTLQALDDDSDGATMRRKEARRCLRRHSMSV